MNRFCLLYYSFLIEINHIIVKETAMIRKSSRILFIMGLFFVMGILIKASYEHEQKPSLLLETIYGDFLINEPVLIELINDSYVQRLKKIRQYGTNYYTIKKIDYNRFDHSIGVFVLLRKYGASLHEQIAGLLHDVSHTVFSHGGDFLFNVSQMGDSYQDHNHLHFINNTSIPALLKKHDIKVNDILHKNDGFILLEQKLPELCADRLEYNLQGALVEQLLTEEDIKNILDHLIVEQGAWIFTDIEYARKFALIPFYFMQNENGWNNYNSFVANEIMAAVLKQALAIGLITSDEIHFSVDEMVWEKLINSDDELLQKNLQKALHIKELINCVDSADYDMLAKNKFRGIDPWIRTAQGTFRLTELDAAFKEKFTEVKNYMEAGWRIKYIQ